MATVTKPLALDESINTTEQTPRNVADVLAEELQNIASAIGGGSGSGGHTIVNASGTDMTQRAKMQFVDAGVTNDSENDKTKVEIVQTISAESDLTNAPDGVYQGTWDESVSDVLTADMVGMGDGTGDTVKDRLDRGSVSVVGDGVKTTQTILNELFALVDLSKVNRNSVLVMYFAGTYSMCHVANIQGNEVTFIGWTADDGTTYTDVNIFSLRQTASNRAILRLTVSGMQRLERASTAVPNSMNFTLYY